MNTNINFRDMPYDQLEHAIEVLRQAQHAGRSFTGKQAIVFSKAQAELARRDYQSHSAFSRTYTEHHA